MIFIYVSQQHHVTVMFLTKFIFSISHHKTLIVIVNIGRTRTKLAGQTDQTDMVIQLKSLVNMDQSQIPLKAGWIEGGMNRNVFGKTILMLFFLNRSTYIMISTTNNGVLRFKFSNGKNIKINVSPSLNIVDVIESRASLYYNFIRA